MKTKTVVTLFAVALATSVIAQTSLVSLPVYTALEAQKHVGETATMEDKVGRLWYGEPNALSIGDLPLRGGRLSNAATAERETERARVACSCSRSRLNL